MWTLKPSVFLSIALQHVACLFLCLIACPSELVPRNNFPAGLRAWGQRVREAARQDSVFGFCWWVCLCLSHFQQEGRSSRPTHAEVGFSPVVIDCKDSSTHTVDFYLMGSSCLFFRLQYYGLEQKEHWIILGGNICTCFYCFSGRALHTVFLLSCELASFCLLFGCCWFIFTTGY